MKTRNFNGLTILGIATLLFSAAAIVPASADEHHDNNRAKVEIKIDKNFHIDLSLGNQRGGDWNRRDGNQDYRDRDQQRNWNDRRDNHGNHDRR